VRDRVRVRAGCRSFLFFSSSFALSLWERVRVRARCRIFSS